VKCCKNSKCNNKFLNDGQLFPGQKIIDGKNDDENIGIEIEKKESFTTLLLV
jgi:hypothetical protein